jgi:hypothetical protein
MKKYIFTLTVTDFEENNLGNNVVNNILEKVREEQRVQEIIDANNQIIHKELQSILDVIREEVAEIIAPLNLSLSTHYRRQKISWGDSNNQGLMLETQIGGSIEHCRREGIFIRVYCPHKGKKLIFEPTVKMFTQNHYRKDEEVEYTTGANLVEYFSEVIEKMYRKNL